MLTNIKYDISCVFSIIDIKCWGIDWSWKLENICDNNKRQMPKTQFNSKHNKRIHSCCSPNLFLSFSIAIRNLPNSRASSAFSGLNTRVTTEYFVTNSRKVTRIALYNGQLYTTCSSSSTTPQVVHKRNAHGTNGVSRRPVSTFNSWLLRRHRVMTIRRYSGM